MKLSLVAISLALPLTAACTEAPVPVTDLSPERNTLASTPCRGAEALTVMTQNLYIGADVDVVIGALISPEPDDDLPALLFAIQTFSRTDFPRRAVAIADEIARSRPHAVVLQEVSTIDIDLRPLGIPVVINQDMRTILAAELAARGLHYGVAVQGQNFQVAPFPGVSITDSEALLVDEDRVSVNATSAQIYAANVGQVAPGLSITRGWVSANVTIGGEPYVIAGTHLESGVLPGLDELRALQASELALALPSTTPAILLGDFNDGPTSLMHQVVVGAGFADVWAELHPGAIGFTCCQLADLSNPLAAFDQRIDYVFTRGIEHPNAGLQGQITLFGDTPAERVEGPVHSIWPSDHAGVLVNLLLTPANGLP